MPYEKAQFSIIICNYNYERFIVEALESALHQTIAPLEVIVVDDGSTDQSLEKIESYRNHPLVKIVAKENAGQISAYNVGFEMARGEFVIFLDSDDLLSPTLIERLLPVFERPNIVKVHWKLRLIDKDSQAIDQVIPWALNEGNMRDRLLKDGILYTSSPGSGNAYRREILSQLFPIPLDPADKHGADYFAIYGACLFGDIGAIQDVLGSYRLHISSNDARNELAFGNAAKLADEPARTNVRGIRFRDWIYSRCGLRFATAHFMDFSMIKSSYGINVNGAPWGLARIKAAKDMYPRFLAGLQSRSDFGFLERLIFIGWSICIVVLPSPIARRLTSWVTNPSSRPKLFKRR